MINKHTKGKKLMKEYDVPEHHQTISLDDLRHKDKDYQVEIMRVWFSLNYQDPVHECPYNGREGGYAYIYGGPYEAAEELFTEFGETIDGDVISSLAEELELECPEWSGVSKIDDYDDYLFDIIGSDIDAIGSLMSTIETLQNMLTLELDQEHKQILLKMLYVNLITSLESYLSEFFISEIERNKNYLRAFIESNPEFRKQKLSLSDIFKKYESIEGYVKKYLVDLLWHNLPKLKLMFKSTLSIDFPESMDYLVKATHVRHDLVHRAGKTKNGEIVEIKEVDIEKLIEEIIEFSNHLEEANKPIF